MYRTIFDAFDELINRQSLTPQQQQTATSRIDTIREFMGNEFSLYETPFTCGSYARGTMCAGERDIDIMAPFEAFGADTYWQRYETDSRTFLYLVRNALNERYATTNVSSKQIAVTLDFNSIKVDLVPCFLRSGGGYLIPNGRGGWNRTNPKYHTELVDNANVRLSYRLKPIIKLAKWWNNANSHHLNSFHIEMMVERMWRDAANIPDWSNAMMQTIKTLPSWIISPFADPWDNSLNIDEYLLRDAKEQVIRMLREDSIGSERAEECRLNNDIEDSFEKWSIVFHRTFPSQIL